MKRAALRLVAPNGVDRDAERVARTAQGDVGALGELYDAHAGSLLTFAGRLVGSNDAEDVVQETFLRVSRVAATYEPSRGDVRGWLYGITSNVVRERSRAFARFGAAMRSLFAQPQEPRRAVESGRSDVVRALDTLSEAKRTTLVLAEVEGFSCDEIAKMLDVPVGTVWTRLHHARRELRRELGREP